MLPISKTGFSRYFKTALGIMTLALLAIGPVPKLSAQQPADQVTVQVLGTSHRLRDFVPSLHEGPNGPPFALMPLRVPPEATKSRPGGGGGGGGGTSWTDPVLQSSTSGTAQYSMGKWGTSATSFDGVSESGYIPSDSNLDVGTCAASDCSGKATEQIVEVTNVNYAVYSTDGTALLGPSPMHTIWSGFTTSMCSTVDGGDPIALFDRIDQRWIISQLAYNSSLNNDHLCLAISTTSDAIGSYVLYDINFGTKFPDYPKLAVWSDGGSYAGIYLSANIFLNGNSFEGAMGCAIPLSWVTNPPNTASLSCFGPNSQLYNLLPADLEGSPSQTQFSTAPLHTPGVYLQFVNSGGASGSTLNLYKYSGLTGGGLAGPTSISVPTYHEACGGGTCVPQGGTSRQLDSLGDRLMYRLSYLGYLDQMVVNHSVQINSSNNQTGVRWYVITHPGGSPTVIEKGTFAPSSLYRWMGSIAQDKNGDLGLGYSTSSSLAHPGLSVTGRIPGDAANTLEPETSVFVGPGSQTSASRWGDYTSTAVAPDGCTFWYVNQYASSSGTWNTRISNFKFNSCN